jgi:hypothetical protein
MLWSALLAEATTASNNTKPTAMTVSFSILDVIFISESFPEKDVIIYIFSMNVPFKSVVPNGNYAFSLCQAKHIASGHASVRFQKKLIGCPIGLFPCDRSGVARANLNFNIRP